MFGVIHHRNLRECLAGISNLPALYKTRKGSFAQLQSLVSTLSCRAQMPSNHRALLSN